MTLGEEPVNVELVISDTVLARRVRTMLEEESGFRIICTDSDLMPDVQITDGLTVESDVPSLVLSDRADLAEALQFGAAGLLSTAVRAPTLRAAIEAVMHGLSVMTEDFRHDLVEGSEAEPPPVALTAREQQVLQLLASGASNKAIARRLGLSVHTAKFHVASIMTKLEAAGRTDAVVRALRMGILMV